MIVLKKLDLVLMNEYEIRIKKILVKNLYEYSCQAYHFAQKNDIIPIAKYRALAHTKNPYADEDDVGLLAAYMGNACIGYLGIMPGLLKSGDQFTKVYWLSAWFVPPQYRKTSVGISLLLNALSLNYDLIVTEMSENAEKVYRGLRFQELGNLNYYVIIFDLINPLNIGLRLLQKISKKLKAKFEINERIIKLSDIIYAPIRLILCKNILNTFKKYFKKIKYEEVKELRTQIDQNKTENNFTHFYRDNEIINWMMNYKWTKERKKLEAKDLSYYFAEIRNVFKFIALKVYSKDGTNYKGFIVLSFSVNRLNNVIKILDYHFFNANDYKYIIPITLKYASNLHANFIELPENLVMYIKKSHVLRLLLKRKKRVYLFHPKKGNSVLAKNSNKINLNYCDGDTTFS